MLACEKFVTYFELAALFFAVLSSRVLFGGFRLTALRAIVALFIVFEQLKSPLKMLRQQLFKLVLAEIFP